MIKHHYESRDSKDDNRLDNGLKMIVITYRLIIFRSVIVNTYQPMTSDTANEDDVIFSNFYSSITSSILCNVIRIPVLSNYFNIKAAQKFIIKNNTEAIV